MTGRTWWTWILLSGLALCSCPTPSSAQQKEKVYRRISTAQVESLLNALDIDYRKNKDKKLSNTYFYEYNAKYKIVLGFYDGTHLWLSANFPKTALDTINKWNINAKFSRAVLLNLNNKETATVESQLDCAGGVTEGMMRQFLLRFDAEVENFEQLLKTKDKGKANLKDAKLEIQFPVGALTLAQGEEVLKVVPPDRLEKILDDMKLSFKKAPLPNAKNSFTYDYERNNYKLRLYNYAGQDLMIDVVLAKADWETVNKWNSTAKFSRASLRKDKLGEFVALESNLDCLGGVTEGTIKQFIRQFDEEVRSFQLAALGPPKEETTYKVVSDAQLEKILESMKHTFKKSMNVNGTATFFDFESKGYKLRLTSFGGKDLMIDAVFKKADLDTINKWNIKRNFIRVVLYSGNPDYTSLEANLDCVGGVSESIVRYFISTFDEEARQFGNYLNGN